MEFRRKHLNLVSLSREREKREYKDEGVKKKYMHSCR